MDTEETLRIVLEEDANETEENRIETVLNVQYPLYMRCYREALNAISESIYNYEQKNRYKKAYRNGGNIVKEVPAPKCENNIIAFIGERGSGKTTAVTEFCSILKKFYDKRKEWYGELQLERFNQVKDKMKFHVLEAIDASVLEKREDLIELILASILEDFVNTFNSGCNVKESEEKCTLRKFNDVYSQYRSLKSSEYNNLGESIYVKLKTASNSLKTRKTFHELVKEYLEIVEPGSEDSYLVITIDDLDLNLEEGYNMLNQLHKYLSDSHVIVLITFDYEQMSSICEKYFADCLENEKGQPSTEYSDRIKDRARRLCNDYLLKVVPISNRIYLPDKKVIMKSALVVEKGLGSKTKVKEFVIRKIARKMYIYYDGCGVKRHFCMPDTVRELVFYNDFLDSFYDVDWELGEGTASDMRASDTKNQMYLYDCNHERFNRDIMERMAYQILKPKQLELFQTILERDIARRASYTVNFIDNWKNGMKLSDDVDKREYSYGKLLESLYELGRHNYDDKALVHCILASFSSEMTREYYNSRYNLDKGERDRSQDRLKQFIGTSIGSEWTGEILPALKLRTEAEDGKDGKEKSIEDYITGQKVYLRKGLGYARNAQVNAVEFREAISFHHNFERDNRYTQIQSSINRLSDKIISMVPELECITLLFTNFHSLADDIINPEWNFKIRLKSNEKAKKEGEILVTSNVRTADFDIFNFMRKEFENNRQYRELNERMADNICGCIRRFVKETFDNYNSFSKLIEDDLSEMRKKVIDATIFKSECGEAVFPFYNLDLAYNVIKRVRKRCIEESGRILDYNEIYDYLKKVYGLIMKELREEETYFKEERGLVGIGNENSYAKRFQSDDFIQAMGYKFEDIELNGKLDYESFNNKLFNILKSMTLNYIRQEEMDKVDQ